MRDALKVRETIPDDPRQHAMGWCLCTPGCLSRHHDPVTRSAVIYSTGNLNHLAHALVSEDIPCVHGRNISIVEMHI